MNKSAITSNRFLLLILAALIVNVIRLTSLMRDMRPSKDDYCVAASSSLAIFDNLSFWFNTWSGNITTVLLGNIFVGLPLTNINSWWLPSALGFFLTLLAFCSGLTFLYHRYLSPLSLLDSFFVSMFISGAFITYFWFSYSEKSIMENNPTLLIDLADSLAMWQTVTIAYFLTPMLLMSLLITLYSIRDAKPTANDFIYCFFAGIIIGFMDYVGIATAIGAIFIIEIIRFRKKRSLVDLSKGMVLLISITLATIVSFFSPGSRIRKNALEISELTPNLELFESIALRSGTDLKSIFLQPSGLLLLGFGLILFLVFTPKKVHLLRPIAFALVGIILSHIVINNISEVFSYFANWHRLPQFILSVVFWIVLGMELGRMLKVKHFFVNWNSSIVLKSAIVTFVVSVQTLSTLNFEASLNVRKEFWLEGKRYHAIDEINTEWIENCWKDLKLIREDKGLSVIRS